MDYAELKIATYKKDFKVNMEFSIIAKNGSEFLFKTFKVNGRYYYRIERYNSLFDKYDFITENATGNCKDDLKTCVIRQIGYYLE